MSDKCELVKFVFVDRNGVELAEKSELLARISELPIYGADSVLTPPPPYLLASLVVEGVLPTWFLRRRRAGERVKPAEVAA